MNSSRLYSKKIVDRSFANKNHLSDLKFYDVVQIVTNVFFI